MDDYDDAPMGHEDAQDRDDIETSYVDVTSLLKSVAFRRSRLHDAKIVIGRKGSGKTHVLKHIQQLSRADTREVIYCHLNRDMFYGKGIKRYRGDRGPEDSVILWTTIWRIALSVAAMSQFTSTRISAKARDAIRSSLVAFGLEATDSIKAFTDQIRARHGGLVSDSLAPLDPIDALEDLIKKYKNLQSISSFLENVSLRELEADLALLLHNYGTIHYLIDGMDEFAWSDPRGWLDLQVGLFNAAFILNTVQKYSQYLRVTISLRNYVFTRAAQSTQIDRARSHILRLNWDAPAAGKFLNLRLAKLRGKNFARSETLTGARPLANWLGFDTIVSRRRGIAEPVEVYLLRHSRLSPRNLVEVFNSLCSRQNALAEESDRIDPDAFIEIVEAQAVSVASLMLKVAAEEMLAHLPTIPGAFQYRETLAPDYVITEISNKIAQAVAECGREVVDRKTCTQVLIHGLAQRLGFQSDEAFDGICSDIEAILWRSGLIAYRRPGDGPSSWVFAWTSGELVPAGQAQLARKIGFHSCLINFCSLEVSADGPVF